MTKITTIFMSILLILGLGKPLHAQSPLGDWEGKLNLGPQSLRIVFHITEEEGTLKASMDSPDQGAFGIEANEASFESPDLMIKVNQFYVQYNGKYDPESNTIKGTFTQGLQSFPLDLNAGVKKAVRPQTPKAPFPYKVEDIRFRNEGENISLAGTLTTPIGKGPFPAVILISGSGPQDRDETIFEHKPFWVIADAFSRQGIAVLRYDDRGVGKSQGDRGTASSQDYADDARAGLKFLQGRKDIDQKKIGMVGHSEGGLIAPLVAREDKGVAFIVMLAGQGTSGAQVMQDQNGAILEKSGVPKETSQKYMNMLGKVYNIILESPSDKVIDALRAQSDKLFAPFNSTEKTMLGLGEPLLEKLGANLNQAWWRFFLEADPAEYMEKMDIPILALFGGKDVQVITAPNQKGLEKIMAKNKDFTSKTYPEMNHLFQTANTGMVSEYGQLTETFSEEVIKDMIEWINKQ